LQATVPSASDGITTMKRDPGFAALAALAPRPDRMSRQVYRRLRDAIIDGTLTPGTRLREIELAQTLNVSRTPLREAIVRLTSDRLVRRLPRGGVEVIDTAPELHDLHHIRVALEACAARLAAARIGAPALEALQGLADQGTAPPVDAAFHDALCRASDSPRLIEMIGGFREFFPAGPDRHRPARDDRSAVAEHREIVEALRARDGERAEAIVRRHLGSALQRRREGDAKHSI